MAQFDPLQTTSQQGLLDAAGQYDTITQDLVSDYQNQLDPNSAINQHLADQAAQSSANAFYGAGTPGSARGQYAGSLAAQDAVRANRENALSNLGGLRGSLRGSADIVGGVGEDRRNLSQDIINEDIERFKYGQLSPQQFADKVLGLASQQEALKQGNVGYDVSPSGGFGAFGNLLGNALGGSGLSFGGGSGSAGGISSLLSGLGFNEGGPVYKQEGGMIDPAMDPGMPPAAPTATGMTPSPAPAGIIGAGPTPPPTGPISAPDMGMETDITSITAITDEDTSEIDKIEGILQGLAIDNPNIKIKRKKKKGGK